MPSHSGSSRVARWGGSALFLFACAAGCQDPNSSAGVTKSSELEDKVIQQARAISQKDDQLKAQAAVIQELRATDGSKRMDQIITVDRIDLESLSGGYDDDRNGKPDGLVLYLKLFDSEGDVLKATGKVSVRVVDVAMDPGNQQLGQADFDYEALKPLWYGRMMTSHYTIKLPWSKLGGSPPKHDQLTVMVTFTDLLTGRGHEIQKVLKIEGLSAAQALPVSDKQPVSQP
jgi:hypothetical protein